jgi:hypothetical protein
MDDQVVNPIHMKTISATLLAGLFALQVNSADTPRDFSRQMMNFYRAPSLEAFQQYQKDGDAFEGALAERGADIYLAVGIARISEKFKWPITGKGKAAARAKEILEGKSSLAKYVADDDAVDPSKLDIWWVSFLSTGDDKYLSKLLRYAGETPPEGDRERFVIIKAASWSFKSNCAQHTVVRDFARSQIKTTRNPEKRKYLEDCIKDSE